MDYLRQDKATVTHLQVAEAEAGTEAAALQLRKNNERAVAADRRLQLVESTRSLSETPLPDRSARVLIVARMVTDLVDSHLWP